MSCTLARRSSASLLPLFALLAALVIPAVTDAQTAVFRTRLGGSGGVTIPLESEGHFSDPGSVWQAQIGVGDDPSVVSIVVGYASFGGHLFENRVASVTQFEIRTDWTMRPNRTFTPIGQFGLGLYRVVDPTQGERRFGVRTAAGMRWIPEWHTGLGLVGSLNVVVDHDDKPRRWLGLSLELVRWVD